ncbi:MAG TPA: hypothetical protein VF623_09535, partial [Segetibacter sp.]
PACGHNPCPTCDGGGGATSPSSPEPDCPTSYKMVNGKMVRSVNPCNVELVQDIIDSLDSKFKCAKALLAQLPTIKTDIAKIINQAFNTNHTNDITFYDGNLSDFKPMQDGYAKGFDIYLNPTVLSNATQEYILVTMYHEALHTYLNLEYKTLGSSAFNAKYPEIKVTEHHNSTFNLDNRYDYYIDEGAHQTQVNKDPQHRTMAEYFTDKLKDAILAFNPSFPVDRAQALARFGIFNDTTISYYNESERDKSKGTHAGQLCPP